MHPSEYQIPFRPEDHASHEEDFNFSTLEDALPQDKVEMSQRQVDQVFSSMIDQEYGYRAAVELTQHEQNSIVLTQYAQDFFMARNYELDTTLLTKRDNS